MRSASRLATLLLTGSMLTGSLLAAPVVLSAQAPPPPPGGTYYQGGPGGWDAPPRGFTRDIQRAAFRDGLDGANKDLQNRRRPNVNNRDEYRNYRGPQPRVYRQAFLAGYRAFWHHQGYRGY